MAAKLGFAANDFERQHRCIQCGALRAVFVLYWTYGNGSSSRLFYCGVTCLPKNRQAEAHRLLGEHLS